MDDTYYTCFSRRHPYLSPTTCPNTTPNAVKTADDKEIAPLKCFGALSPKYMGCTFMLIPEKHTTKFLLNIFVIPPPTLLLSLKHLSSAQFSFQSALWIHSTLDEMLTQIFNDTNDIPAFIPTRTREIMIISKDLAALLVTAESAPVMRKMLFSNKHFFLGEERKRWKLKDC